jgi:hypothetical protein
MRRHPANGTRPTHPRFCRTADLPTLVATVRTRVSRLRAVWEKSLGGSSPPSRTMHERLVAGRQTNNHEKRAGAIPALFHVP